MLWFNLIGEKVEGLIEKNMYLWTLRNEIKAQYTVGHSKIDLQSKKRLVNNSLNSKTGLPAPGQYNNYGLGSRSVYDLWTGWRHIEYRRAYTNEV